MDSSDVLDTSREPFRALVVCRRGSLVERGLMMSISGRCGKSVSLSLRGGVDAGPSTFFKHCAQTEASQWLRAIGVALPHHAHASAWLRSLRTMLPSQLGSAHGPTSCVDPQGLAMFLTTFADGPGCFASPIRLTLLWSFSSAGGPLVSQLPRLL